MHEKLSQTPGRVKQNFDIAGICGICTAVQLLRPLYRQADSMADVTEKERAEMLLRIPKPLMARIEKFRHRRMFRTKTEAIIALLEAGLKANPPKPE